MSKIPLLISNLRDLSIPAKHTSYIIPGVLYPAIEGKDIKGDAIGTYTYGDVHVATGLKYYYTDIKGSKPIKDPRIGAHFGSQRYTFRSIQLLEQETATHGSNVYSVDGREWCRAYGTVITKNDNNGHRVTLNGGDTSDYGYFEVVGYFSDVNLLRRIIDGSNQGFVYKVDDGSYSAEQTTFETVDSPLRNRYLDGSSLLNVVSGQTLGIHTFVMRTHANSDYSESYGIELIAQDTTSTATKSQIQIPAQDVASYGKNVSLSASTPHYDPFDGFTSGTDISTYIDTATSLGMAKWKVSSTYYRPYNGMRVVKWVGTDGIKTSVTAIPPNAKSYDNSGSLTNGTAKSDASAANDTFYPTFEAHTTSVDEDLLSEVAKTYNFREFGNGAANGGAGATYADFSMITGASDACAYVMDDGLTSLSGATASCDISGWHYTDLSLWDTNGTAYLTFIGTGISTNDQTSNGTWAFGTIAQNLPYGTHVVKLVRDGSTNGDHSVDGVACATNYLPGSFGGFSDVTFHQPKMPPIPEDAVVIADYMLMADFVATTSNGNHLISKGVRACSHSRDIFYDEVDGFTTSFHDTGAMPGMGYLASSSSSTNATNNKYSLPAFGTTFQVNGHTSQSRNDLFINDTDVAQSGTSDGNHGDISYPDAAVTLGMNKFAVHGLATAYSPYIGGLGWKIASPIHTSSHYQTFETPFLHELVGGDRNMEQTNLVVTPDGKTWDEVTRDTSYIGNNCISASLDASSSEGTATVFTDWRGIESGSNNYFNKDFAIAYDRMICLKDGWYNVHILGYGSAANTYANVYVNGTIVQLFKNDQTNNSISGVWVGVLKRGDYVQSRTDYNLLSTHAAQFRITRVK